MNNNIQFNNNPIIFYDLAVFLQSCLKYLFKEITLINSISFSILKILENSNDNYKDYLTEKYTSLRFDEEIEIVGMKLLKELIELCENNNSNMFEIDTNRLLNHINLGIKHKTLSKLNKTTVCV